MTAPDAIARRSMELFERLLRVPEEGRAGFLDEHCTNALVRERVEAMLQADSRPDGLLEQDADQQLAALSVDLHPKVPIPARIGAYRVVDLLGEGGMATVYRAERADHDFDQTVALKLIRPSRRSEHWYLRFRQERQILASLQHPNIASLLDGGLTGDGEPYFAMEYVDGLPITNYSDAHNLSIPDRLHLFLSVCNAVNHAHGNLIVHRDLKPSNILVNADGLPKLLDFGIAKLLSTEGTTETETNLRALTPDYAAPEQFVGGPVTTAVDIYALGGLLYELLAGRRPFFAESGSALDIERTIRERGAPTFSQLASHLEAQERERIAIARGTSWRRLQRTIHGDLENIALKALRAEPERRYKTANALVADLRRYLDDLPVMARADSRWYRLTKFYKRHPVGFPLGLLATIGLTLSTGYALQQASQARAAATQAQLAAARATETKDFVASLFEFADPDKNMGDRLTARQLLDLGAKRVHEELAGQPELRAEMLLLLANTYGQLGRYETALPLAVQASELYASTGHVALQFDALVAQARLKRRQGDFAEATNLLNTAESMPEEHDRARRSTLLVERGEVYREQADFPAAKAALNEALALDRARSAPATILARDLYRLGTVEFNAGEAEVALGRLRKAVAHLVESGAQNTTQHASIEHDIGVMLIQRGDLGAAKEILDRVREVRTRLLGTQHPDVAVTLKELAGIARQQGESETAERLYLRALEINEQMLGSDHPETSNTLNSLAVFYRGLGSDALALDYALRALRGAIQIYGPQHPTVGLMTVNVGSMQRMLGDLESAQASCENGLSMIIDALGDEHHLAGVAYNALAGVQQDQGNVAEAESNYRRALVVFETTAGTNHPHTVGILNGLASVLLQTGRVEEALEHYRRAVDTGKAALPEGHPNLAIVQLGIARIAALRGRCDDASELAAKYLPYVKAAGQLERPDVRLAITAIEGCR